jgi:hypothetical protein
MFFLMEIEPRSLDCPTRSLDGIPTELPRALLPALCLERNIRGKQFRPAVDGRVQTKYFCRLWGQRETANERKLEIYYIINADSVTDCSVSNDWMVTNHKVCEMSRS